MSLHDEHMVVVVVKSVVVAAAARVRRHRLATLPHPVTVCPHGLATAPVVVTVRAAARYPLAACLHLRVLLPVPRAWRRLRPRHRCQSAPLLRQADQCCLVGLGRPLPLSLEVSVWACVEVCTYLVCCRAWKCVDACEYWCVINREYVCVFVQRECERLV